MGDNFFLFLRSVIVILYHYCSYIKFLNELYANTICYSVCALYLSLIFAVYAVINVCSMIIFKLQNSETAFF